MRPTKETIHRRAQGTRLARFIAGAAVLLFALPLQSLSAQDPTEPAQSENSYQVLAADISAVLAGHDWGGGVVRLSVVDSRHGIRIIDLNAKATVAPGGVMKILLAAAALDVLGPAFRFETELQLEGRPKRGAVSGSLIIKASGDPTIRAGGAIEPYALFDQWAEALRARKVKKIKGTIYIDAGRFDSEPFAPGWPLHQLGRPHLPEIAALNLNGNCLDFSWLAGKKAGRIAEYKIFPELGEFMFVSNNVRLGQGGLDARNYRRQPGSQVIDISGYLAVKTEATESASILSPPYFFVEAMKTRLARKGVRIEGEVVIYDKSPLELDLMGSARSIHVQRSPPLGQMLRTLMREDRNLDAEVLLKTLGYRTTGEPGSFANGAAAVMGFMQRERLASSGAAVLDGSGLSSLNRLSTRQVVGVIEAMARHRHGRVFAQALPAGGAPGILSDRFIGAGPGRDGTARLLAMPGTPPAGVSLAGRVTTRGALPLTFAIIVSHSQTPAETLRRQIDAVIMEIANSSMR